MASEMEEFLHSEECLDVAADLAALATEVRIEPLHWITDGPSECEHRDLCRGCADLEIIAAVGVAAFYGQHDLDPILDGGWPTEQDTHPYCDSCGVRLECNLTDYGARQELDHFKQHGLGDERCPDTAYDLAEMLSTLSVVRQSESKDQAEALDIGRRFLALRARATQEK